MLYKVQSWSEYEQTYVTILSTYDKQQALLYLKMYKQYNCKCRLVVENTKADLCIFIAVTASACIIWSVLYILYCIMHSLLITALPFLLLLLASIPFAIAIYYSVHKE